MSPAPTSIRRVVVLWSRLGPYHTARLNALRTFLAARDVELITLETASTDQTYAWAAEGVARTTLFPGRVFESIPGPSMEDAVRTALDRFAPDAVAVPSYSTPDARAALAWCRRRRRTAVMLFDSSREDTERAEWRERIKRTIVRQFDAALVAGTPQRTYAVELGIPPAHVFQPLDVVSNARFARLAADARQTRRADDPHRFLAVSRLTPVKGVDVLLDAYARYRAAIPDPWALDIVGDGPERDALESQAGPGVTFHGFAQGDALGHAYGQADALVLPSRKDTWGLVVNEGMAAGLPVVVSQGAGCATDLVENGANGFTMPPADADTLADRLVQITALPDAERIALGDRSREIIADYDLDAFCDGLWNAVRAGHGRADRGLSPLGRITLTVLRLAARHPRAFQAIPD